MQKLLGNLIFYCRIMQKWDFFSVSRLQDPDLFLKTLMNSKNKKSYKHKTMINTTYEEKDLFSLCLLRLRQSIFNLYHPVYSEIKKYYLWINWIIKKSEKGDFVGKKGLRAYKCLSCPPFWHSQQSTIHGKERKRSR